MATTPTTVGRIPATVSIAVGYNGTEPIVIATASFDIAVYAELGEQAAGIVEAVKVTSKPPIPSVRSEIADALRKIADEIAPAEPWVDPEAWDAAAGSGRMMLIPEKEPERIRVLALPTYKFANAEASEERTPFILLIDRLTKPMTADFERFLITSTGANMVLTSPDSIDVEPGFDIPEDLATSILERISSVKSETIAPIVERIGRTVTEASVAVGGEWFEPADIRPLLEAAAADVRMLSEMAELSTVSPALIKPPPIN